MLLVWFLTIALGKQNLKRNISMKHEKDLQKKLLTVIVSFGLETIDRLPIDIKNRKI